MIKKVLKAIGLHVYAKYIREKYLPARNQRNEKNLLPERVKFYSQFLSAGDLCYDVGANIGNRTKIFLQLGARVVAFEPQSECVKMLKLPEKTVGIVNCLAELSRIGPFDCNYTLGEKMQLELKDWVTKERLLKILSELPSLNPYGDIYIRSVTN